MNQLLIMIMIIATPANLTLEQVSKIWLVDGWNMQEFGEFASTYKGDSVPNIESIWGLWSYEECVARLGTKITDPVWGFYDGRWQFKGHFWGLQKGRWTFMGHGKELEYVNRTIKRKSTVTTISRIEEEEHIFEKQHIEEIYTINYDTVEVAHIHDPNTVEPPVVEPPVMEPPVVDPNIIMDLEAKIKGDPNMRPLLPLLELLR